LCGGEPPGEGQGRTRGQRRQRRQEGQGQATQRHTLSGTLFCDEGNNMLLIVLFGLSKE